ncbi:MAG: hypothetical protein WEB57_08130 [Pseudohongiellaceae bacterium]
MLQVKQVVAVVLAPAETFKPMEGWGVMACHLENSFQAAQVLAAPPARNWGMGATEALVTVGAVASDPDTAEKVVAAHHSVRS